MERLVAARTPADPTRVVRFKHPDTGETREISIDDIDAYQHQQARARARRKERYRQPKEAAAAMALLKMLVWVAGKIVLLVKAVVAAVARVVTMAIALLPPTAPRRWPQAPISRAAAASSAYPLRGDDEDKKCR